jgi:hypothetical protein
MMRNDPRERAISINMTFKISPKIIFLVRNQANNKQKTLKNFEKSVLIAIMRSHDSWIFYIRRRNDLSNTYRTKAVNCKGT